MRKKGKCGLTSIQLSPLFQPNRGRCNIISCTLVWQEKVLKSESSSVKAKTGLPAVIFKKKSIAVYSTSSDWSLKSPFLTHFKLRYNHWIVNRSGEGGLGSASSSVRKEANEFCFWREFCPITRLKTPPAFEVHLAAVEHISSMLEAVKVARQMARMNSLCTTLPLFFFLDEEGSCTFCWGWYFSTSCRWQWSWSPTAASSGTCTGKRSLRWLTGLTYSEDQVSLRETCRFLKFPGSCTFPISKAFLDEACLCLCACARAPRLDCRCRPNFVRDSCDSHLRTRVQWILDLTYRGNPPHVRTVKCSLEHPPVCGTRGWNWYTRISFYEGISRTPICGVSLPPPSPLVCDFVEITGKMPMLQLLLCSGGKK